MKSKIFLVTFLIFIKRLTTADELNSEDIKEIKRTLKIVCENSSEAISKAVKCLHQPSIENLPHGSFGAIIRADLYRTSKANRLFYSLVLKHFFVIFFLEEMKVEELTLPSDWHKKPEIQPTPIEVTPPIEVRSFSSLQDLFTITSIL